MDINLPKNQKSHPAPIAATKTNALSLKLNQQLEVKVISSKIETQTLAIQIDQSNKPTMQVQSNLPTETKPGQTLQLLVTKLAPLAEFKVLNSDIEIKLKQFLPTVEILKNIANTKTLATYTPTVIAAKILSISDNQIQLKLATNSIIETKQTIQQQDNAIFTLTKAQLTAAITDKSTQLQHYKPGQTVQLTLNTKDLNPEFKPVNTENPKLNTGQILTAQILGIKNNKIQLQLNAFTPTQTVLDKNPVISLNRNQLTNSATSTNQHALKPGQLVKLEVIKTGVQTEFKLIDNKPDAEQKILETLKKALPIQAPPPELINQIINNLDKINKNENIPDTLKRLAREILDSIPQIKNLKNLSQLKNAISNSGLLMEAKLGQSVEKKDPSLQADFKALILKFNNALNHELDVKQKQKESANDVNLIKEMQQKTENTLAKIILNQLASLPKEEGARQVWILDLPFLNKESAESVKIEIDREQHSDDDETKENWAVTITITPPDLATIHCKISCFDKTVNTRFWSDTEEVVSTIEQNLGFLKIQFEKAGINPGHMSAHTGSETKEFHQHIANQGLFDQQV